MLIDVLAPGDDPPGELRPLTHLCRESGEVYRRDATIERQIEAALCLVPETLLAHATIADDKAADYLKEETLTYLIRDYLRRGREDDAGKLCEVLAQRCIPRLVKYLGRFGQTAVEDAHDRVMTQVWERILDLKSDRGDFFQVRFWQAFRPFVIKAYMQAKAEYQRDVPLPELEDESWTEGDGVGVGASLPSIENIHCAMELEEILGLLPEPLHTALIMRDVLGFPIESIESGEPTISRYFGKTPRTIRNWFDRIERIGRAWRAGRRES